MDFNRPEKVVLADAERLARYDPLGYCQQWRVHRCGKDGCENVLVIDGNGKLRRKR